MKPVIVFAITLVAGLGAGTGAKVMTTHPAPAVADSTKADSTKADSLNGEGGEHGVQQAGEAHAPADTAVVASDPGDRTPAPPSIEVGTASALPTSRGPKPTAATASNAAAIAAALEARVDSAKHAAASAAKAAASAPAPIDTAAIASQRRVAKIFTSMDAKAAAKVLVQMNDNDIHVILGFVGPKQAAQILTELPPERVAKLSKLEMGTKE